MHGKGSYILARSLFLRMLSAIYLVAFISAEVQMKGLYGSGGILPVAELLSGRAPGVEAFLRGPTVFWLASDDSSLLLCPMVGAAAAFIALLGLLEGPALFACWFLYLSLVTVGQQFMSFQWDVLLLESGFLSLFLASWRPLANHFLLLPARSRLPYWLTDRRKPSKVVLFLFRLLLLRLMFFSGLVKLESQDRSWAALSALTYHFQTQPLPTPPAYLFHQMPAWFLRLSCFLVFVVELIVPLGILSGGRLLYLTAGALISLQLLIMTTGNYCFFNWLTIALTILLLDDHFFYSLANRCAALAKLMERLRPAVSNSQIMKPERPLRVQLLLTLPLICLLAPATIDEWAHHLPISGGGLGQIELFNPLNPLVPLVPLKSLESLADRLAPWRLVNNYGLFAVMTTKRPEIILEGSDDGIEWRDYGFRYKPGALDRPPPVVAPYQPRLDWQMWFAALGSIYDNPWLLHFSQRLLEGSADVEALLEKNPFPNAPPRYIRARLYEYSFTTPAQLMRTGNWWKRKDEGLYMPPVSLKRSD